MPPPHGLGNIATLLANWPNKLFRLKEIQILELIRMSPKSSPLPLELIRMSPNSNLG